ncbi:vitamin D3 receptor-like isoform X2 [Tubulanus polymorphus]|uniref:vitamin D3 receptor-like isoform X2 n=1 Tax=Tubulanus polymorphus TaxID=672921 RepID=UPI003DA22D86
MISCRGYNVYRVNDQAVYSMNTPKSASPKRERRKRRLKPPGLETADMICGVCGDKAHGYNFNAITCESCKAFFRRNALRMEVIKCNFDGTCKLDPHTRRFCTECRLKKCFTIGMKKEWILSDDQLMKRREKGGKKEKNSYNVNNTFHHQNSQNNKIEQSVSNMSNMSLSPGNYSDQSDQSLHQISPIDHCASMDMLPISSPTATTTTMTTFVKVEPDSPPTLQESPSSSSSSTTTLPWQSSGNQVEMDIATLEQLLATTVDAPYTERDTQKFSPNSASDMFNMADTFIRRFIKFCKSLPEFSALSQTDQIALLKGGIMEVMILRGALKFDPVALSFKFTEAMKGIGSINSSLIDKNLSVPDNSQLQYHGNAVHFFKSMNDLVHGNKTCILLLLLIELFSPDRPNIDNRVKVEYAQEHYSNLLQRHIANIYSADEAKGLYPKILMKLVEVRELGDTSSKAAARINVSDMEPLLVEVFSLST